jgi:glutamate synthase (NADPH/NADH) small chain
VANGIPLTLGHDVAVVGGGNTAMDCARSAVRLGARNVRVLYRRGRGEMPCLMEEVEAAEAEGVRIELLIAPVRLERNGRGLVLTCQRMTLGEPDASGRRRPVEIPGSEFVFPCDMVVVAIGTKSNPLLTATSPDLRVNKWGYIEIDDNLQTSMPGVFAGGDIVRGAATVILAMGDGKKAASNIDAYLRGVLPEPVAAENAGEVAKAH